MTAQEDNELMNYVEYAVELAKQRKQFEKETIERNEKIKKLTIQGIYQWEGVNDIKIIKGYDNILKCEYYSILTKEQHIVVKFLDQLSPLNIKITGFNEKSQNKYPTLSVLALSPELALEAIAKSISLTM